MDTLRPNVVVTFHNAQEYCFPYPPYDLHVTPFYLLIQSAAAFGTRLDIGGSGIIHVTGEPDKFYGLRYIPHHCVINSDGIIKMNYDSPTSDYTSFAK